MQLPAPRSLRSLRGGSAPFGGMFSQSVRRSDRMPTSSASALVRRVLLMSTTAKTYRSLRCSLFGESLSIPWPADRPVPPEPLVFRDIEVSRDGVELREYPIDDTGGSHGVGLSLQTASDLWRECWDQRLRYSSGMKVTGEGGLQVWALLRMYETAGPSGDVEKWRESLDAGRVGWRTLELERPDLLSVPFLQQWKAARGKDGLPINPPGRQVGTKAFDEARWALDLLALGDFWLAKERGRPITWKEAAERSCKRFPELLTGSLGGTRHQWLEEMVERLQKKQTPQKRWKNIRERRGGPPR